MSSSSTAGLNLHPLSPPLQGNSAGGTPRSSTQSSPTVNLTHEYNLAVQTSSYSEIWSKIHTRNSSCCDPDQRQGERKEEQQLSAQVLHPNRECVQEALQHVIRPKTLVRLVSTYFDTSEKTSNLYLLLQDSVHHARSLYAPLHEFLDVFLDSGSDSLTESQCNRAFDIFQEFDRFNNPFTCPDSHNFDDMRHSFSQLKQQLDCCRYKTRSRVRRLRHATTGSAICLIGTVGIIISAVAIASHAFVALVVTPFLPSLLPSKITKKERAHLAQLEVAARGTYALHNDLDTIDRLVARLHTAVEGDKLLVRLGLDRGRERHPIQEVVKQLHKNHPSFIRLLEDLEEHICLCFAGINRTRSFLLQEIHSHRSHFS